MPNLEFPVGDDDKKGQAAIQFTFDATDNPNSEFSVGDYISIYIPSGINFSDAISYSNTEIGITGRIALSALGGRITSEAEKTARANVAALTGSREGTLESLQRLLGNTVRAGASRFSGVEDVAGLASGKIVNPNLKAVFRGVDVRTYNFTFNLIPQSTEEADVINQIVKQFRTAAYPETETFDAGSSFAFFLKYPTRIQPIIYPDPTGSASDDSPFIVKFQPSYLTSVSVTHNPTSTSYHAGGAPVETVLGLTFTETEILTRNKLVEQGY